MTDEVVTAAAAGRHSADSSEGHKLSIFSAYLVALTSIGVGAHFGLWTFLGVLAMIAGPTAVWRFHRSAAFVVLGFWLLVSLVAVLPVSVNSHS
jgi:hypothetical protein